VNKKALWLAAFALVAAAQLAVPAWMIVNRERMLRDGRQFRFRTQPVDPADAFRGRYVWVRLDPDRIAMKEVNQWEHNQRGYAVLATGTNGYAKVVRLDRTLPAVEPAIPVHINWTDVRKGEVFFSWPLDRYYVEERKAPAAETAYRKHNRPTNDNCYVTVRVRGDDAVLENLFIDGKPIREVLGKP